MIQTIIIIIDGQEYEAKLLPSETVTNLLAQLPLELELTRYAEHEYYAELPEKLIENNDTTSHLLPGHLYYWGAGNSFVINFEDYDIAPYQSVHLGEISDPGIADYLGDAGKTIKVQLREA